MPGGAFERLRLALATRANTRRRVPSIQAAYELLADLKVGKKRISYVVPGLSGRMARKSLGGGGSLLPVSRGESVVHPARRGVKAVAECAPVASPAE